MPSLSRRRFLQTSSSLAAFSLLRSNPSFAADADLIVRTSDPYNAEPRLLALVANQITPVNHFYVRNHGPIPTVDVKAYKLTVDGMVNKPLTLTFDELQDRFTNHVEIEATLTCAGNRRQELSSIKSVGGVQWDAGAIGNATWAGIPLADVLTAAGIQREAKHIWFEALDPVKEKDGSVAPFGGSVPVSKVMDVVPKGNRRFIQEHQAILAYSMNGQPLTPEHGFPLRTIVPGYIGARSVKWLTKITLSDRPSPNHYVAEAYKIIQSDSKDEAAAAEPIYSFPVNAAICAPAADATVKAGSTRVSGYALPAGDPSAKIEKVEISADGGKTWTTAQLFGDHNSFTETDLPLTELSKLAHRVRFGPSPFTWQHWTANLNLPAGKHELVVRATDTAGHSMPERGDWNFKGYLYNGWHRITVEAA